MFDKDEPTFSSNVYQEKRVTERRPTSRLKTSKVHNAWVNGSNSKTEEDRFKEALLWLFQRSDPSKLTDDAIQACKKINAKPEDLLAKTAENFSYDDGKKVHDAIIEVRFKHYKNKRMTTVLKVFD